MTQHQFIAALQNAAGTDKFIVTEAGWVRQGVSGLCPLCVVANNILKSTYGNHNAVFAGSLLGMSRQQVKQLIKIADDDSMRRERTLLFLNVMKQEM